MNAAPVHLGGAQLLLDPGGTLAWPEEHMLVVADLHLEKASHFAVRGNLLPPVDTGLTLERLARAMRHYAPRVVVALGDSFHDAAGASRLSERDAARIEVLARQAEFVWVAGNHDPAPQDLPGLAVTELAVGGIVFRHAPQHGARHEICGHLHPKARVPARGTSVTRPCFVADGNRIVLPAFGEFTGGLDVRHPEIAACFPRGARAFLLGKDRLFSFSLAQARAMVTDG
jgi:uncharacterized protein